MTLSDRITDITRILTEWPEADRLAGVLRVVREIGAELETEREGCRHTVMACDQARAQRDALSDKLTLAEKVVEASRDLHTAITGGYWTPDTWEKTDPRSVRAMRGFVIAIDAYDAAREGAPASDVGRGTDPSEASRPPSPEPPAHVQCECGHSGGDHTPINSLTLRWGCRVVGCVCGAWVPPQYAGPIGPPHPSEGSADYVAGRLSDFSAPLSRVCATCGLPESGEMRVLAVGLEHADCRPVVEAAIQAVYEECKRIAEMAVDSLACVNAIRAAARAHKESIT